MITLNDRTVGLAPQGEVGAESRQRLWQCSRALRQNLVFTHSQDYRTPAASAGPTAAPQTLGTSPRGHPTAASHAITLALREDHRSCVPANRPASRPSTSPPTGWAVGWDAR